MKNCQHNSNLKKIIKNLLNKKKSLNAFSIFVGDFDLDYGECKTYKEKSDYLYDLIKYMIRKGLIKKHTVSYYELTDDAYNLYENDLLDEEFPD